MMHAVFWEGHVEFDGCPPISRLRASIKAISRIEGFDKETDTISANISRDQ
jgi:hypothetical protein